MIKIPRTKIQLVKEHTHLYNLPTKRVRNINDSVAILDAVFPAMRFEIQEVLVAIFLSCKNDVLNVQEISRGTIDTAFLTPRDVFAPALLSGASATIIAHNHPSGDDTPSIEDISSVARIAKAGILIGIPLLDSLVIGRTTYTSMLQKNLIPHFKKEEL
ncbi:MAG: JAB domain-containing protein [Schwartzia succinivorans]|nr:JAB domain-containing protein [Schwartzia succinivorans]